MDIHALHGLADMDSKLHIDDPKLPIFYFFLGNRPLNHLRHHAQCLPCRPVLHVDKEVASFLHDMLLIYTYVLIGLSSFALVNVHLMLCIHAKGKTTLALYLKLHVDLGNLIVVCFHVKL